MGRQLAIAAGAGLASALLFLSAAAGGFGVLLTFYLAPLPLYLIGLGLGPTAVLVGNGAAAALLAVVLTPLGAAGFVAFTGAAPYVMARQALLWRDGPDGRDWYPVGHLLVWAAGLAVAGIGLVALGFGLFGDGIVMTVEQTMASFADSLVAAMGAEAEAETQLRAALAAWIPWIPGVMATMWLVTTVVNGALAQGLLSRSGRALRPSPAYSLVELPPTVAAVLGLAAVAASALDGDAGLVARAVAMVLTGAYALVGLAVVHRLSRAWAGRALLLGVLYTGLIFQGWLVVPVAILGLVETWVRLRQRQPAR